MNAIQRRYAAAVVMKEMFDEEERRIEQEVIKEMNLIGADGEPIKVLYSIEDEATYKNAEDLLVKKLTAVNYATRLGSVLEEKNRAANELIEWSLKIFEKVHQKEAQILRENSKRYKTREKLIELAMKI